MLPSDLQILSGLGQIRALAQPDRLRILQLLRDEPKTGAMLATELGTTPNRVRYHVQELLKQDLIRHVGTGRKRWKQEQFYIASARHYLVDPGVGVDHEETVAALLRTAEVSLLDWRRQYVLDIDLAQIAARTVHECLRIESGEKVLVQICSPFVLELAEAVIVELHAVRATPRPVFWTRNTKLRLLDRHLPDSLAELPFFDPTDDAELDAGIILYSTLIQGAPPNQGQQESLPYLLEGNSRWYRGLVDRGVRHVEMGLPHRAEFEHGERSVEESLATFWNSLTTAPEVLQEHAQRILGSLPTDGELTLKGPKGSELVLTIEPTRHSIADGVVSAEDARAGRVAESLPAGTLSFVIRPETASGVLRPDYFYRVGRHHRNVEITVENGRLVHLETDGDAQPLRDYLDSSAGDADLIAQIDFGLNPAGPGMTGKASLDSCLEGVVTVHFGNNQAIGGEVSSTAILSLPCSQVAVESSGGVIVPTRSNEDRR